MLFAPEDLALVKGDPSERRRFLDDLLVARQPRWAGVRADYDKVLKQRNALLKSAAPVLRRGGRARSRPTDEPVEDARASALHTLDLWNAQLAQVGAQLLYARLRLLRDLGPYLAKAYDEVSAGQSDAKVAYRSSLREEVAAQIAAGAVPEMQELHDEILATPRAGAPGRGRARGLPGRAAPRRRGPDPRRAAGQGVRQPRRVLVVRARRCGSRRTSCCGTTSVTTPS